MSVNALRHFFASFLKSVPDLSVGEHEKYAKKMGHSLEKSLEYVLFDEAARR